MPALFATTLFVSATLLFLVQPMIAKMILPKFGGTPAVWNTCMVFFQAVLLAGYSYAHYITTRFDIRRQTTIQVTLLAVAAATLLGAYLYDGQPPVAIRQDPPGEDNPVPWLLFMLLVAIGIPFFMLSTGAPLLQKWFAATGHPSAKDPYFLYAASNAGSMLALVFYPQFLEREFRLPVQSWIWTTGFLVLVGLTATCAYKLRHPDSKGERKSKHKKQPIATDTETDAEDAGPPPGGWQKLHWVALAFVPSSLMLGATTYMSTDIAPIPLIWVIPLALYLLSFILVFARLPVAVHNFMILTLPVLVLLQMFMTLSETNGPLTMIICLHLLTLFAVAMVCHGELARQRPATRYLTTFYLLMSLGGVLGGMFNALIAPLVFNTIVEYPLVLVLACLLMPPLEEISQTRVQKVLDYVLPVVLAGLSYGLLVKLSGAEGMAQLKRVYSYIGSVLDDYTPDEERFQNLVLFGIPALLCYSFVARPIRFALGVGGIFLASALYTVYVEDTGVILRDRSFFGLLKVEQTQFQSIPNYRRLVHGTTLHGKQCIDHPDIVKLGAFMAPFCAKGADGVLLMAAGRDKWDRKGPRPLTYYALDGPIGQVIGSFNWERITKKRLGLIGLGTGSLAAYGKPGMKITFFEIDPTVVHIANNYFDYLRTCEAETEIVLGDARLSLKNRIEDGTFDILVVDAFSSDAIPFHLITKEALELYLKRLKPDGIVAFHISNRYLNLRPVVANLAAAVDPPVVGLVANDEENWFTGKAGSTWVIVARRQEDFGRLVRDSRWEPLEPHRDERVGVWTDDFSNLLSVFDWGF
ncbi:MAG: hypothetical protein KatS3mg105_4008 [Gemmatales bacterium]|nr:MAG: hypothetical protein KatS3mg105_4008 [Gemmatales bacterium]